LFHIYYGICDDDTIASISKEKMSNRIDLTIVERHVSMSRICFVCLATSTGRENQSAIK
jgi:hypothetical protein